MTKIIGFAHRKRVGKDSAAKFLETAIRLGRPGIKTAKLSFASKLKEICHSVYGWAGLQPAIFYEDDRNAHLREVILPEIGKTPREIWIEVGNKFREVYPATWIDCALQGSPTADVIIVTDVRFENEVNKIHQLGGKVVKIVRPGIPVSNDASDSVLDNFTGFDRILHNDSNLKVLHDRVVALSEEVLNGSLWR